MSNFKQTTIKDLMKAISNSADSIASADVLERMDQNLAKYSVSRKIVNLLHC